MACGKHVFVISPYHINAVHSFLRFGCYRQGGCLSAVYHPPGFVNNMAALEPVPQPTRTHML